MKKLARAILTGIFRLVYDKKYLCGKHFTSSMIGFVWCFRSLSHILKLKRRGIHFPVGKETRVANGTNLEFDPSSLNVFQQPGCYFQNNEATITIGKDVHIAANVGLITQNHDPANPDNHLPGKPITIGDHCWIGMNAVVLPGVELGAYTTVGAGAVVTHSFPGNCVIAGNPAKVIRTFEV